MYFKIFLNSLSFFFILYLKLKFQKKTEKITNRKNAH